MHQHQIQINYYLVTVTYYCYVRGANGFPTSPPTGSLKSIVQLHLLLSRQLISLQHQAPLRLGVTSASNY